MTDEAIIYPYRKKFFIFMVVLFFSYFSIHTILEFILLASSYMDLFLYRGFSIMFSIIILVIIYNHFKNNPFMILKENLIIINPNSYFFIRIIDINKIERIVRPSSEKTIIYYRNQNNRRKKVIIGKLGLNIADQMELNEYIEGKRGVKFIQLN